ncbi:MAG: hypothetical protein DMG99_12670 [Acidobacteria bacterium]|nr:MAG: hypothetical protein DMG99_12670 [Acidobacteriota bacterium]
MGGSPGLRGVRVCKHLLLCAERTRTALVLAYAGVGGGSWDVGNRVGVYLRFFNTYSKTYGSLGAVIILMLWFYLTGLSFLIGSQINATIEHAAAEHGHIEAKGPGERKAA